MWKNPHLCVNQGDPNPVVSKQSRAPGPEFVHLLKEHTNRKVLVATHIAG